MVNYNRNKDVEIKANSLYDECVVLYKKKLFFSLEKKIVEAKKYFLKFELFENLLKLQSIERDIFKNRKEIKQKLSLDILLKENEEYLKKLQNKNKFVYLHFELGLILRTQLGARSIEFINNIETKLKGFENEEKTTVLSQYYWLKSQYTFYVQQSDSLKRFAFAKDIVAFIEKNDFIKQYNILEYISALFYQLYAQMSIDVKDKERIREIVDKLNCIDIDEPKTEAYIFQYLLSITIHLKLNDGSKVNSKENISFVNDLTKDYKRLFNLFQDDGKMMIQVSLSMAYHNIGKYIQALGFIDLILAQKKKEVRKDLIEFSTIFELLLHFELENYDFIRNRIQNINRSFPLLRGNFKTEKKFILFLKNILKNPESKTHCIKHFSVLKKDMKTLSMEKYEAHLHQYFNYTGWADSKISTLKI